MIRKLRLVSVAVPDLEEALGFYRDALGLPVETGVEDPHHALRVAHLRVGETALALFQPVEPETPVGRFLEQRGSALYHISFEVDDIETQESPVCISGQILKGLKKPHQCPAFGKECTPLTPLGATMVSSEGACAAYHAYGRHVGAAP